MLAITFLASSVLKRGVLTLVTLVREKVFYGEWRRMEEFIGIVVLVETPIICWGKLVILQRDAEKVNLDFGWMRNYYGG